jgi:hypothetical protein
MGSLSLLLLMLLLLFLHQQLLLCQLPHALLGLTLADAPCTHNLQQQQQLLLLLQQLVASC